jgi:dolichyl-phosphate-mannose--protein O-mannosyl transferase
MFTFWRHYFILILIVVAGAFLRLYHLGDPPTYIFDEVYHVPTAKLIAAHDPRAYEWWHGELLDDELQSGTYIDWLHPPLAKLIQAGSLRLFGDVSWAWRLPSAVAGILLIIAVYALTRAIMPTAHFAPLIAAGLVSVDGLAIAQSRIAMNDIFVTLWLTLALRYYWLYTNSKSNSSYLWFLAGSVGCAIASKWSGILIFGLFAFWELFNWLIKPKLSQFLRSFYLIIFLILTSAFIYLLSYAGLFTKHNFSHFQELHRQIFAYQFHLDATHAYSSPAWTWPLALYPVYLHLDANTGRQLWNRPFYLSGYLAVGCLVLALMIVVTHFFTGSFTTADRQLSFLLLAYCCLWLPWVFSPRIMFFHHYLPALPCVWVISGLLIDRYFVIPLRQTYCIFKSKS